MQRTKLFIEERQKEILNYINEKERASIEDIMNMFNISKATVRRDLIDLEKKNLVIRTRGGALRKKFFKYESTLKEKIINLVKKKKIAIIAKRFVNDGDVIFIGGGTTTLELARLLHNNNLIVFTNAINILLELIGHENIKIRLLGGSLRKKTFSTVGEDTINQMQKYIFKKSFIEANGVSIEKGITMPNEFEARVDGEVIKRSRKTFLLVDDTKFDSIAFSVICKLDDIDYIVTNRKIDEKVENEIFKKKWSSYIINNQQEFKQPVMLYYLFY